MKIFRKTTALAVLITLIATMTISASAREGIFTDYISNYTNEAYTDDSTAEWKSMRHIYKSENIRTADASYLTEYTAKDTDEYGRYRESRLRPTTATNVVVSGTDNETATWVVYKMDYDITGFSIDTVYMTYSSGNTFCDDFVFYFSSDDVTYTKYTDYEKTTLTYGQEENTANYKKAGYFVKFNFASKAEIPDGMRYFKIVWPKQRSSQANALAVENVSLKYDVEEEETVMEFEPYEGYNFNDLYKAEGVKVLKENKPITLNDGETFDGYGIATSNATTDGSGDAYVIYELPKMDSFEIVTYRSMGKYISTWIKDFTFEISSDGKTFTPFGQNEGLIKTIPDDTGYYINAGDSSIVKSDMPYSDFRPAYTTDATRVDYKTIYGTEKVPEGTRFLKVIFGDSTALGLQRARILKATFRYFNVNAEISNVNVIGWADGKLDTEITTDKSIYGTKLIAALYKGGALEDCALKVVDIAPDNGTVTLDIERPDNLDGYSMKVFLWQGGTYAPWAEAEYIESLSAALGE